MIDGKFTKDDKEQIIEFLNRVAKYAKFNDMDMQEVIEFYKNIAFMQKVLLPKIDSNILEFVKVVEKESADVKEE